MFNNWSEILFHSLWVRYGGLYRIGCRRPIDLLFYVYFLIKKKCNDATRFRRFHSYFVSDCTLNTNFVSFLPFTLSLSFYFYCHKCKLMAYFQDAITRSSKWEIFIYCSNRKLNFLNKLLEVVEWLYLIIAWIKLNSLEISVKDIDFY